MGTHKTKIPNHKFQIPNKFQIPMFETKALSSFFSSFWSLVLGACLEFGAWSLVL
jgi:hypothetical protein